MFRLYIPIALAALFLFWILFRLVIKKDLHKNYNTLFLGLFFISIWAVIYIAILKD